MSASCLHCGKTVGNHHQAIDCDRCGGWQHRGCGVTGLTKHMYRRLQKGEIDFTYTCRVCLPVERDEVNMDAGPDFSTIVSDDTTATTDTSILLLPRQLNSTRTTIHADLQETSRQTTADGDTTDHIQETSRQTTADGDTTDHIQEMSRQTTADGDTTDHTHDVDDTSFLVDVTIPDAVLFDESSIADVDPTDSVLENTPVSYDIITGGTAKGKDILIDTDGYSYNVKCIRSNTRTWWCSVRNKKMRCPATVLERGGEFRRGIHNHGHPAEPGKKHKVVLSKQVKEIAADNVFRPAKKIVEQEMQSQLKPDDFAIPDPELLVRKANRHRQANRPEDPRGNDFELAEYFIPDDFLRKDLTVNGARHIIFATQTQLQTLQQAKTWYLDGTFKILRQHEPFEQLFTIHAFLKKDGATKQVPLVFVFMSRRRKKDYKQILKIVKTLFGSPPSVQAFVLDFEAATWAAIRSVFPDATIRGCAFHWSQAVFRKTQAIGLQGEYTNKGPCHKYVRQLLALPLLPAEHIRPAFAKLQEKATDNLRPLVEYVESTWMDGIWEPEVWSVYGQPIRTNNDCEGWHRRLNFRSGGPPPFYLLVHSLHEEAGLLPLQVKLMTERKLKKVQRKSSRTMQAMIFSIWDAYAAGDMSTSRLLKRLSAVYAPTV